MSTETKYLVMSELIGIPAAAIEKAEEQASRIIQIVHGGWTKEEIDKVALKWQNSSIPCSEESLDKIKAWMGPPDPDEDFTANSHPKSTAYKPLPPGEPITGEDIAFLKGKRHTWPEIAVTTGLTQDKARHLYRKWQKTQKADVLYEPGAEEAAAEAQMAEEVLKSANQNERGPSKKEQIDRLIASMDSPNALDIEILQAVQRQFSGCGLTVADVRARRRKA